MLNKPDLTCYSITGDPLSTAMIRLFLMKIVTATAKFPQFLQCYCESGLFNVARLCYQSLKYLNLNTINLHNNKTIR